MVQSIGNSSNVTRLLGCLGITKRSERREGSYHLELGFHKTTSLWDSMMDSITSLTEAIESNLERKILGGLPIKKRSREGSLGLSLDSSSNILSPPFKIMEENQSSSILQNSTQPVHQTATDMLSKSIEVLHQSLQEMKQESDSLFKGQSLVDTFVDDSLDSSSKLDTIRAMSQGSILHTFLVELQMSENFRERFLI